MHVISPLLGNLDACESYVEEKNTPVPIRVKVYILSDSEKYK